MQNPKYKDTEEAYSAWRKYALAFGFANRLNSDFNNELKGNIAPVSYYDKYYGSHRWSAATINSLSIGQGEVAADPSANGQHGSYHRKQGILHNPACGETY